LAHQQKKGAMLALGVGSEKASKIIGQHAKGYAIVAAINSPQSVSISRDPWAIENVSKAAEEQGLVAHKLKVEIAHHSQHMVEVASFYLESIKTYCDEKGPISEGVPRPAFVSSVSGRLTDPATIDAAYWLKNIVQPVRLVDAIQSVFTLRQKG
jgi:acyl transferase domain-containing protein